MDQVTPAAPAAAPSFTPEQSPHWEERQRPGHFFDEEFPFHEGFPRLVNQRSARYEIVLRDGEHCLAVIDDSREFMAEGLEWMALTGEHYNGYVVAAWKRIA